MPNEQETSVKHEILSHTEDEQGKLITHCSCGAFWSHPKERTQEEIDGIFQSHLKYFNRPKMETI